jgi:hypothetical protein
MCRVFYWRALTSESLGDSPHPCGSPFGQLALSRFVPDETVMKAIHGLHPSGG